MLGVFLWRRVPTSCNLAAWHFTWERRLSVWRPLRRWDCFAFLRTGSHQTHGLEEWLNGLANFSVSQHCVRFGGTFPFLGHCGNNEPTAWKALHFQRSKCSVSNHHWKVWPDIKLRLCGSHFKTKPSDEETFTNAKETALLCGNSQTHCAHLISWIPPTQCCLLRFFSFPLIAWFCPCFLLLANSSMKHPEDFGSGSSFFCVVMGGRTPQNRELCSAQCQTPRGRNDADAENTSEARKLQK